MLNGLIMLIEWPFSGAIILALSIYFCYARWRANLLFALAAAIIISTFIVNMFFGYLGESTACSLNEVLMMQRIGCSPASLAVSYSMILAGVINFIRNSVNRKE